MGEMICNENGKEKRLAFFADINPKPRLLVA